MQIIVFHPLQRALMKNATKEYACSLTVDFAANVTDQAAHKLGQLSNLKQSKKNFFGGKNKRYFWRAQKIILLKTGSMIFLFERLGFRSNAGMITFC